jgi:hypothetical protein
MSQWSLLISPLGAITDTMLLWQDSMKALLFLKVDVDEFDVTFIY